MLAGLAGLGMLGAALSVNSNLLFARMDRHIRRGSKNLDAIKKDLDKGRCTTRGLMMLMAASGSVAAAKEDLTILTNSNDMDNSDRIWAPLLKSLSQDIRDARGRYEGCVAEMVGE
jgi:hypothetical protein